jgi:hypothetical protein
MGKGGRGGSVVKVRNIFKILIFSVMVLTSFKDHYVTVPNLLIFFSLLKVVNIFTFTVHATVFFGLFSVDKVPGLNAKNAE